MTHARIQALAVSPVLLVATDFDGTISPLVPKPSEAQVNPRCLAALGRLARLPRTAVAVISGRPLAWLREMMGTIHGALLFGSHGAEDGTADVPEDAAQAQAMVPILAKAIDAVASRWPGCLVERKPFGVAIHYRAMDAGHEDAVIDTARAVAARHPVAVVRLGSKVVEICVSERNKENAVRRARYISGATHVVFFGDDLTDEDAFRALSSQDLSVRVAGGESLATARATNIEQVGELLEVIAEQRTSWLAELQQREPGEPA